MKRLAGLALAVSVLAVAIQIVAVFGTHLEMVSLGFALLTLLRWGAYAGAAGAAIALVALLASRASRTAASAAAVVLGLLAFIPPAQQQYRLSTQDIPSIHDITTDTDDPPAFVDVLPLRASAPNTTEYGGPDLAAQQKRAYPDLAPLVLSLPPAGAFDRALATVEEMGWDLVAADPAAGRIEATDTTFWFRFKDDIVIRLRSEGTGTRVDVRSVSRVGRGDVGTNAHRIRAYLSALNGA
ncbi:MAG: DUF1499 domain-containing protein [Acidimicrobiia bacterium]|nr:DUF1499 domain-containing protein [Acidimicrobiia bacterium]